MCNEVSQVAVSHGTYSALGWVVAAFKPPQRGALTCGSPIRSSTRLTIADGGSVFSRYGYIGYRETANNNTATVTIATIWINSVTTIDTILAVMKVRMGSGVVRRRFKTP